MNKMCKILVFLLLAVGSANADFPKETALMTKALPDVPGKEGLVETVVLAPGQAAPAHRHNADVFAYVLAGSIITQVQGGKPQTVHVGEVFTNRPRTYTWKVATRVQRNPRRFSSSM
jgi:quercetin dioxygenase-like cupin family protein